jgi:dTDP-4-amino-4,6-dideoxygalactose transaminase
MVDLQSQYARIKPEVDAAIQEVIDTTQFINGPAVRRFTDHLATYLDVPHVIPCANGTDALQIALMALDLQPGDEVITTPFTFVATAEVIALLKLKPVFVDVHPGTFNLDESLIEQAITPRTRVIIPVHLFGQGTDMGAILDIAERHHFAVVEDNAQAIGAEYRDRHGRSRKYGAIGHIGCTSFFPSKNLGCYGDGGALFTHDPQLADRISMIVNHGMKVRYYHDEIGVNSRLDSIQAAVLDIKLGHLDSYNAARQEAAARYNRLLAGVPGIRIPERAGHSTHVFHQYTLRLEARRDEAARALQAAGIPHGIYYPVPLHLQKAYRSYGYREGDFPVSEMLAQQVLSLPMHTELDAALQDYIVQPLRQDWRR